MYAANFDYYRASSAAGAVRLLGEYPGAKLLAGGHSLIPLLKLRLARPVALIDIGHMEEMRGLRGPGNGALRIGPLTTHGVLASSPTVIDTCPLLAEAASVVGDPQVRNRGTIGGNVAHADPASDLPPALVALGAQFTALGPSGRRTIEASDFFQGLMATALADNEVLVDVQVPTRRAGQGMAYVKFPHPASRYAVIGVAAVVGVQNGQCQQATVVLGGLVSAPTRATAVEQALVGRALSPEVISEASARVGESLGDDILGDHFASAEYRQAMAPVYVRDALTRAAQRAEG